MNTMTEAEKWRAYNLAKQALGIIISDYSERIGLEREKETPDQEQIKKWRDERLALERLRESLFVEDMTTIEQVNKTYGSVAINIIKMTQRPAINAPIGVK